MSGLRLVVCLAIVSVASLAYARTAAAFDGSTPALPVPVSATVEVTPAGVAMTAAVLAARSRIACGDGFLAIRRFKLSSGAGGPRPRSGSS